MPNMGINHKNIPIIGQLHQQQPTTEEDRKMDASRENSQDTRVQQQAAAMNRHTVVPRHLDFMDIDELQDEFQEDRFLPNSRHVEQAVNTQQPDSSPLRRRFVDLDTDLLGMGPNEFPHNSDDIPRNQLRDYHRNNNHQGQAHAHSHSVPHQTFPKLEAVLSPPGSASSDTTFSPLASSSQLPSPVSPSSSSVTVKKSKFRKDSIFYNQDIDEPVPEENTQNTRPLPQEINNKSKNDIFNVSHVITKPATKATPEEVELLRRGENIPDHALEHTISQHEQQEFLRSLNQFDENIGKEKEVKEQRRARELLTRQVESLARQESSSNTNPSAQSQKKPASTSDQVLRTSSPSPLLKRTLESRTAIQQSSPSQSPAEQLRSITLSPSTSRIQDLLLPSLSKDIALSYMPTPRNRLGEGRYAIVYKGQYQYVSDSPQPGDTQLKDCAVKRYHKEIDGRLHALSEGYLLRHLNTHTNNVVKLVGIKEDEDERLLLILDWAKSGDLATWCKKNKESIGKRAWMKWARQIAEGVRVMHSLGIIHHDIKPSNVLLDDFLNCKISDFGNALFLPAFTPQEIRNFFNGHDLDSDTTSSPETEATTDPSEPEMMSLDESSGWESDEERRRNGDHGVAVRASASLNDLSKTQSAPQRRDGIQSLNTSFASRHSSRNVSPDSNHYASLIRAHFSGTQGSGLNTYSSPIISDTKSLLSCPSMTLTDGLGKGTAPFSAPETLSTTSSYSFPADIYSIGASLYSLITGKEPFHVARSGVELIVAIKRGFFESGLNSDEPEWRFTNGEKVDEGIKNVIRKCVHRDPLERYSADELCLVLKELDDGVGVEEKLL